MALPSLGVVIEGDADGAAVVAVVLADDLLAVQLPEAGVVVAAGRDEVRAVGAKGAVPDPALVALEGRLQRERAPRAAHHAATANAAAAASAEGPESRNPRLAAVAIIGVESADDGRDGVRAGGAVVGIGG